MNNKSDFNESRLSATEASRSFSRILDEAESGRTFVIRRRGKHVCAIGPPPPTTSRRASECLAILRDRDPVLLDDRFGQDLLLSIAEDRIEERPTWES